MARFNSPLDNVRVAAPCSADWDSMIGNDLARFCGQCNLNVYNLSGMTKSQAESFITSGEGRLCVRFYRRRDGSILTDNCPVGLRKIRRRAVYLYKAVASAVLTFFAGIGVYEGLTTLSILSPPPRYQTVGVMVSRSLPVLQPTPEEVGKLVVMGGVRASDVATDSIGKPLSRSKKSSRNRR